MLRIALDELAMQNVLATAHQPEDRPIGYRQNDYAENTNLKHRSLPIGQVSGKSRIFVKSCKLREIYTGPAAVSGFSTIMANAAAPDVIQ